nr:hypothetical protein [Brucella intermedia]
MAETKYTKGPWDWETPLGDDCYSIVQAGLKSYEWQFIAHVHVGIPAEGMMPRQEALANARLIAAAPDLYEALKLLLSSAHDHQTGIQEAEAALAKARGETHPSGGDRHGE